MLSQRMVAAGECRAGSRRWKGKPEAAAMRDRLRLLPAPCACVFPTTLCLLKKKKKKIRLVFVSLQYRLLFEDTDSFIKK